MSTASEVDTVVLALLKAQLVNVHDGDVRDSDDKTKTISAPLPYYVYYTTPGYPINPRMGGAAGRAQEFQITSVGKTRMQAVWAGDRAEETLDGARVALGRRGRRISRTEDNPYTRRDDTWSRPDGGPLFLDVRRYVLTR